MSSQGDDGTASPIDVEGRTTQESPAGPAVRASDADRQEVGRVLHEAVGQGLLTLDEVDERLAAAHAARFVNDLTPLTADLPANVPSSGKAPGWSGVWAVLLLQLQSVVSIASDRHGAVRAILSHRRFAAVAAALLLAMAVGLAVFLGIDID